MKNKTAFAAVAFLSFILASFTDARPDREGDQSSERLFQVMDADHSQSIDEEELLVALQLREEKRSQRIDELEARNSPKADRLQARADKDASDEMLGDPDTAAVFIIANFDSDGDWELNREEMGQAFSTLRKWRNEDRTKTS